MALVVSILFILAAYSTDRQGGIDEIAMFNPSYMYAHYGKLTHPVHGYPDSLIVHPPTHYLIIGALMRAGMSLYYAQATPTLAMVLLCIWLIIRSPFPAPVKIGFLYGLWVSMAVLSKFGVELFGMRPEGHLGAAWLASLVLLESGRLRNWNLIELFAGAFLMAYACSLHYYAGPGALGAVVYLVWSAWKLRKRAWKAWLAIAAGALLYAVPFAVFYFIPHQHAIFKLIDTLQNQGDGGRSAIGEHLDQYRYWSQYKAGSFWLQIPDSIGIPLVLLSTPILFALRSTRGIALAALPLELFLLFWARHKHGYYYIHEVALYAAAVVAGSLTLLDKLATRVPSRFVQPRLVRPLGWAAMGIAIAISFWNLDKWRGKLTISVRPRVHELDIARAVGREIVGADATVATRVGAWYSSGGRYWYNPAPDILWGSDSVAKLDLQQFFSLFDAVVESPHMSDEAHNPEHHALLSWYLDGILHLRAFFFPEANSEISNLFFQAKPPASVHGYGLRDGRLFRFSEAADGDSELIVFTGPREPLMSKFYNVPMSMTMDLPSASPSGSRMVLAAALAPRTESDSYVSIPGTRIVQRVRGKLTPVDWREMVKELRESDQPMQFYTDYRTIPGIQLPDFSPPR